MMTLQRSCFSVVVLLGSLGCCSIDAWIVSPAVPSSLTLTTTKTGHYKSTSTCRLYDMERKKGFLELFSPYESNIPPELRDEIYAAEANTPAAKERGQRVALYGLMAFCGLLAAFFNGFLTELRTNGPDGNSVDLVEAGFDWVVNNPILGFLFLNKIGGGLALLTGAGAGLLAEAELDTKRINAEKIYEELERRRQAKTSKKVNETSSTNKKRKRSGKESKRLVALSEVIVPVQDSSSSSSSATEAIVEPPTGTVGIEPVQSNNQEKTEGLLGSLKSLYDKADTMAASQALLLNKQLEDAGIIEKITDETGLKVIGKDEAAKIKEKKDNAES